MFLIQRVSAAPLQSQSLVLEDGSVFSMTMYFRPIQQGWFLNELVYGDFVLRGLRIVNSPNMLHQFRNQLPFGLACFSINDREPQLLEDFSSGNSKLYVLSSDEVKEYAEYLANG